MNRSEEILAALKKGEKSAFQAFFSEYYEVLVLFATGILKDVDAAEDVVQDCFVNVWENRHFEKLSNGLDRYMFHLVKNAALNDLRGTQRRELRHEKVMAEMALENENGGEGKLHEMEILYAAINQLPLERRRVFMMICAEGMKYQDVADTLGVSINTVRTQMGRSMKFLREKLKDQVFTSLLCFWMKVKKQFKTIR